MVVSRTLVWVERFEFGAGGVAVVGLFPKLFVPSAEARLRALLVVVVVVAISAVSS